MANLTRHALLPKRSLQDRDCLLHDARPTTTASRAPGIQTPHNHCPMSVSRSDTIVASYPHNHSTLSISRSAPSRTIPHPSQPPDPTQLVLTQPRHRAPHPPPPHKPVPFSRSAQTGTNSAPRPSLGRHLTRINTQPRPSLGRAVARSSRCPPRPRVAPLRPQVLPSSTPPSSTLRL